MPESQQIIVTGASRGIGAAIATTLNNGAHSKAVRVVGLSRTGDSPPGADLRSIACDITDEAAVADAFRKISQDGPITGLVNNAGLHINSPSAQLPTAEYAKVMDINATAVMVACREAHPYLKASGHGTIVNIGSFFDKLGVTQNLAYCASKAAVGAITRCLAVEWAADDIRVINVAPGYIETDLNRDFLAKDKVRQWLGARIPTGAPGSPEQVADLVAMLFDNKLSFLTGETIYLDGGHSINH